MYRVCKGSNPYIILLLILTSATELLYYSISCWLFDASQHAVCVGDRLRAARPVRTVTTCWVSSSAYSSAAATSHNAANVDWTVSVPSKSTHASRFWITFLQPQHFAPDARPTIQTKIIRIINLPYANVGASHAIHGDHWAVLCEVRVHVHETTLTNEKWWLNAVICSYYVVWSVLNYFFSLNADLTVNPLCIVEYIYIYIYISFRLKVKMIEHPISVLNYFFGLSADLTVNPLFFKFDRGHPVV